MEPEIENLFEICLTSAERTFYFCQAELPCIEPRVLELPCIETPCIETRALELPCIEIRALELPCIERFMVARVADGGELHEAGEASRSWLWRARSRGGPGGARGAHITGTYPVLSERAFELASSKFGSRLTYSLLYIAI